MYKSTLIFFLVLAAGLSATATTTQNELKDDTVVTQPRQQRHLIDPTEKLLPNNQEGNSDSKLKPIDVDEVFKVYDYDHNNVLSFYEFNLFCSSNPLCPESTVFFDLVDANEDGKVSYKEMVWMAKYTDIVLKKFQMDDKDSNGFITMDEISSRLCDDEMSCDFIIVTYDIDGDHKLNFTEYLFIDLIMTMNSDTLSEWNFEEALLLTSIGMEEGTM